MKNKLYIAAAGAGKTTLFVKKALECTASVLITTFTRENEKEIRTKFLELNNGVIPANVTIQTWFSFLIEHGAKPFQGLLTEKNINGLLLVNEKSGIKTRRGKYPQYYPESDIDNHYFSKDYRIYSDKLSKFVVKCNKQSKGSVISRISAIFSNIFIDEIQDLVGYDLELIKLLFKSNSNIRLAGDPRQVTYHTHFSIKHQKYSKGKIQEFITEKCKTSNCFIDTETLKGSWRNNKSICAFANNLFPDYPQCRPNQDIISGHDGVFLVREKDINYYLNEYAPLQLRYSRIVKVNNDYPVKNFGESKGSTHKRVLIYPTKEIYDWVLRKKRISSFETRCKFYVALTRAQFSIGIVCHNELETKSFPMYRPK